MSTAVAWRVGHQGAAVGRSGLRKARESVKFAQDSNDWLTLSIRGDEGGGLICYRRFHTKTRRL
jgi:hypothetical protein